jgi:hypothetical protein
MLRANSRLRQRLDPVALDVLTHLAGSVERILPHVETLQWTEGDWRPAGSVWNTAGRREIRITMAIGHGQDRDGNDRSLTALVRRRAVGGIARSTLEKREYDICNRIVEHISYIVLVTGIAIALDQEDRNLAAIRAVRDSFDELIVAEHIEAHHHLHMPVRSVLAALHTLSEQTYENKALVFGCVLDPEETSSRTQSQFPEPFLSAKKYKALSDGFRTAYHISAHGDVVDFVDLDRFPGTALTERHYFPDWAESMARVSRFGRCGIVLTRQGDVLIFDEGSLRFTYRYGRWRYWNHAHVVRLLRDRARAQRVPRQILGNVVGSIYRAALDISFRRSGGLFVILHNRKGIRDIIRDGDAIGDKKRVSPDIEFDSVVRAHKIQSLPRSVAVELASLDGAVVLANSGEILAYGAILQPKKAGAVARSEGSRTKAAIGASHYGLAIKISSDGDITIYHDGKEFFRI